MGTFRANSSNLLTLEGDYLARVGFNVPPIPDYDQEQQFLRYIGRSTVAQTIVASEVEK